MGQSPQINEPGYLAEVRHYVPVPLAGKRPDFADRIERGPLRRFCEETGVMARLWKLTGRREYADDARARLVTLVDVWQIQRQPGKPWKRLCFFSAYPAMDAYVLLKDGGQLDGDFQKQFREFARETYFPQERGSFNQAFARAAGLALAAKTFPDVPEAAGWRKEAEEIWDQWYRERDTTENAACYNAISLTFLFLLGDALGKSEQFHDPAVRRMFERFRNQAAPSGAMPEYGDSGDAQWAMFHCWGNWVCAMERAGRMYSDPTYRWVAVCMFRAAQAWGKFPTCQNAPAFGGKLETRPTVDGMNSAYGLCLAEEWRDKQLVPRPAEIASLVARRREPDNERARDKLILAPSRRPGAPFAMSELFARSYHAHEDQLGALLYYEVDDVPLLHGMGYHNRAAEQSNLLFVCPPGEAFPHKPQAVTPGVWNEAVLFAKRLRPVAAEGAGAKQRHFDKVTFRVEENSPIELLVSNLRLSGPKGELVLDDFQENRGWHGGRQELVAGPAGKRAMKVSLRRGANFFWRDGFNRSFSLDDYDQFKFSWKMIGPEEGWSKSLIFRVDGSPTNFYVPLRGQTAQVMHTKAESHDGDQFGEFDADWWFTTDTRLVRRMVLLSEGILVVCDRVLPGRRADGWTAGPLWHLQTPSPPETGANWFDAAGPRRLLIWMAPSPGRTISMQTAELWSGVRPYTAFAKETLHANQPVEFVTVLVPHTAGIAATELAGGIRVSQVRRQFRTQIDITPSQGPIQVQIGGHGDWRVRRGK